MSELLRMILRMSASGSIVILAVLAVRAAGRRAPKLFAYALWIVVLFRLLCPVAVESKFSAFGAGERAVYRLAECFGYQTKEEGVSSDAPENMPLSVPNDAGVAMPDALDAADYLSWAGDGMQSDHFPEDAFLPPGKSACVVSVGVDCALFFVWIAGMAALLGYALFSELRLRRFLRTAVREDGNIYVKSGIQTPFVLGVFAPKIYLPDGLGEREREYLLLHERTHIRRGDPFTRRLAFLALTLHWFNPLAWAAFFLSGRDMEMACDERVLKLLGDGIKRDYSNSLLAMADERRQVTGIPMAFAEGDTGKRIRNVLQYHRTGAGITLLCVCVFAAALFTLATNPKSTRGEQDGIGETPVRTQDGQKLPALDGSGTEDGILRSKASEKQTARQIYANTLRETLKEAVQPNGLGEMELPYQVSDTDICFAVCDVDGDGREELVLLYDPGIMAAMYGEILDVDPESGEIRQQLGEFPDFHFLQNGNLKVLDSHNQTYGEAWPYVLYQYQAESDSYRPVGHVHTMDRSIRQLQGLAEEYPDEADVSGTGTVYFIGEGNEWSDTPEDESVYRAWLADNQADEEELELTYLPLTEENIRLLEQ